VIYAAASNALVACELARRPWCVRHRFSLTVTNRLRRRTASFRTLIDCIGAAIIDGPNCRVAMNVSLWPNSEMPLAPPNVRSWKIADMPCLEERSTQKSRAV